MRGPAIGSLFSGYGGLDLAAERYYQGRTVWHAEIDKAASQVLATRWPDTPNLGDITAIGDEGRLFSTQWADLEPVDILTGGFPCQDISRAGTGAGLTKGTRSGLWYYMADAISHIRPRLIIVENVPLLRSRGLAVVLSHLAALGYDAEWCSIRASDIGAPHQRDRIFLTAHPAANPSGQRHGGGENAGLVGRMGTQAKGRGRQASTARQEPGNRGHEAGWDGDWAAYTDAIRLWEAVTGRPAPTPVDRSGQLNVRLVEWMMGLADGWVTDVVDRRAALKLLGNGVVPLQAETALEALEALRVRAAA